MTKNCVPDVCGCKSNSVRVSLQIQMQKLRILFSPDAAGCHNVIILYIPLIGCKNCVWVSLRIQNYLYYALLSSVTINNSPIFLINSFKIFHCFPTITYHQSPMHTDLTTATESIHQSQAKFKHT